MGKTNQLGVLADVFTSDASNNVGIGGSPSGSYKLEVTGTAKVSSTLLVSGAATFNTSVNITKSQTDNTNTLVLSNSSTTGAVAAAGMSLQSYNGTSTVDVLTLSATGNSWSYQAYGANAGVVYAGGTGGLDLMAGNASGAIKFFTAGDGTGNQRMTITSSGNVGIGTTSPPTKFAVKDGTDTVLQYYASGADGYLGMGNEAGSIGGGGKSFNLLTGTQFTFATGGTTRLTITSAGAATFSSSVTATKLNVGTDEGYALNITTTGYAALFKSTGSSANIPLVALNSATSGVNNIMSLQTDAGVERAAFRYDRSGDRLQLVANGSGLLVTGAATFSNSLTVGTDISLGTNQRLKLSGGAGNLTGSTQTTISSTIATIFSGFELGGVQTGNLVIVNGVKSGTGWNFTDLVFYMTNGTINVISSTTVNTPPARTYSVSGLNLRLLIAGGDTGFVGCTALTQGYQG